MGLLCLGLLASLILWLPLPFSVHSPFVIVPGDAVAVHVPVPGRLENSLQPGTTVERGETLATLTNVRVKLEAEAARTSVNQLRARVRHLEAIRSLDEQASLQLPVTRDALASAEQRLQSLSDRAELLNVPSPRAGTILPARPIAPLADTKRSLSTNHPIASENRGTWLTENNRLCYVGDPMTLEATLIVGDDQIEHLRIGQSVSLMPQSATGQRLRGRVREIASVQTDDAPRELVAAGLHQEPSAISPTPHWQVTVRIDSAESPMVLFSPGRARIDCGRMTLASRITDIIRRTFATKL